VETPESDARDEIIAEKLLTLTIRRKHGNALVSTLRKTYGCNFAPHCGDGEKLRNVFHKMDTASLTELIRDHKAGKLAKICGN
jgi:hypothetical protein